MDLSYDNEDPIGREAGREKLLTVLRQPGPPILLVRSLRKEPSAATKYRETFVDDVVNGPVGTHRLYWFSPGFRIDEDGTSRWPMGATVGHYRASKDAPRVTLAAGLIIRLLENGAAGRRRGGRTLERWRALRGEGRMSDHCLIGESGHTTPRRRSIDAGPGCAPSPGAGPDEPDRLSLSTMPGDPRHVTARQLRLPRQGRTVPRAAIVVVPGR